MRNVLTQPDLMIQFSKAVYSGSEESRAILVTVNLVGGVARRDFNFFILTLPMSATGNHLFYTGCSI